MTSANISSGVSDGLVDVISFELALLFLYVGFVIVSGIISIFGIGVNIINIVVFVKQGFKDSINISLLGLAVADLMCVISTFWMCFASSPIFPLLGLPVVPFDLTYITGSWSRTWAQRITSVINSFIALERCLCIAMPLKIKLLITHARSKIIIISIFVITLIIFSPFYYNNRLEWRFHSSVNRSLLTLVFAPEIQVIEPITFLVHSICLPVICMMTVICCTIILIVKLNKKTKWRMESSTKKTSNQDISSRKDQKVVKLVLFISIIFIICYMPATVLFLVMTLVPDFGVAGRLIGTYYVVWTFTIILETINSTVIIFVYLRMSTKFRETFMNMFRSIRK